MVLSPQDQEAIEFLNNLSNQQSAITAKDFDPSPIITELETIFGNFKEGGIALLYNTESHTWSSEELLIHIQQHDDLIQKLENIINTFTNQTLNAQQTAALNKVKQVKQELETDIMRAQNGENFLLTNDKSYMEKLVWVANNLKGRYLEIKGREFLEKIPSNFEVVDLAQVNGPVLDIFTGNLSGATGELRTDIGIFDRNIAKNITMKWTVGKIEKQGTLADFFDAIKNSNETISIPNNTTDYINNLNSSILGIQAKSGYGEMHFLKRIKASGRKFTLADAIAAGTYASAALKQLNTLTRIGGGYEARLTRTHSDYNALFNYCLGKYLTMIIGKENQIMLTREGFFTVSQWLQREFDIKHSYMKAGTNVHIDNAESSVAIDFGAK